jgi:hypothetical protein
MCWRSAILIVGMSVGGRCDLVSINRDRPGKVSTFNKKLGVGDSGGRAGGLKNGHDSAAWSRAEQPNPDH